MAAVVKAVKTVRTNWKKSILFSCVAVYGVNYAQERYDESLLRREYCLEAKKYGDTPQRTGERSRKVTVFLNPAAKNGRCRKLFEKNVAPILHLAGLEVTVVRTEHEGQAKKFMDVTEHTDGIVIAGGNGTLLEVVTGMFRRKDKDEFCRIPLGVMPLGYTNSLADTLVVREQSDVKWMLDCAMSVVRAHYLPADVMAIKSEKGSVFAVSGLEWGSFKDAEQRKKKNWYFGPLKHYWTYVRSVLKQEWPPRFQADLSYQRPCEGCSRCYVKPQPPTWRWWHILIPPKQPPYQRDYSGVDNPECGQEHVHQFDGLEFSAATRNHDREILETQPAKALDIQYGSGGLSRMDFISEGWNRVNEDLSARKKNKKAEVQTFSLTPKVQEGEDSWFSIDGEQFEVMPIRVELWQNKINFFCKPTEKS